MKKIATVVIAVIAVLVAVSFVRDMVIKISVEKGVEMVTGLKMHIGSFRMSLVAGSVGIKDMKIYNGPQFKEKIMADFPEIYVSYDLPAIIGGKIRLKTVRLNLKQFIVVKNEKGELNLNSLKVVKAQSRGVSAESEGGAMPPIQIDTLDLKIKQALYKDYSASGGPSIKEYNIDLDRRYTNITNPYALVSLIVVEALSNTAISGMTGFDINGLKGTIGSTLAGAKKVAATAVKTTTESAQTAVKTTSKAVSGAASALGGALTNPFGSDQK